MPFDPFLLSSYQYELPAELIAQQPCTPRDRSRLMIVERSTGTISEIVFRELIDFLSPGDSLVFNDTKVIPSRLFGKRKTGGEAEIFLTSRRSDNTWEALVRPGKKLQPGTKVYFSDRLRCEILDNLEDGLRLVRFDYEGDFDALLQTHGQVPLPPYIKREQGVEESDKERYQTIFAAKPGAVAAPTAGLHFTEEMLQKLKEKQVAQMAVTLHVGLGTFRPVQTEDIRQHMMHAEKCYITPEVASQLNCRDLSKKQICVGTTCCRTLESVVKAGAISPGEFSTDIFIYPGYTFRYVRHLLTNFHLPGSTLLMLVSAFAGRDLILEAYHKAIKEKFRFFSYGDAMLIL